MVVFLFSPIGINIYWKAPESFRPPTKILSGDYHSGSPELRDHLRRHVLWNNPRLQAAFHSQTVIVHCSAEKSNKSLPSTEVSLCHSLVLLWDVERVWQDSNLLPYRENSETSPALWFCLGGKFCLSGCFCRWVCVFWCVHIFSYKHRTKTKICQTQLNVWMDNAHCMFFSDCLLLSVWAFYVLCL